MNKMSTSELAAIAEGAVTTVGSNGFFARLMNAFASGRQRQADLEVQHYLARQSDRTLLDIGMSEMDILDLRERHGR